MQKSEVIKAVASQTGVDEKLVEIIVNSWMNTIKQNVTNGISMEFREFGTWSPKLRAEKLCRNIKKNIPMTVPAHYVPFFKVSPLWKKDVKANNPV